MGSNLGDRHFHALLLSNMSILLKIMFICLSVYLRLGKNMFIIGNLEYIYFLKEKIFLTLI